MRTGAELTLGCGLGQQRQSAALSALHVRKKHNKNRALL